MARSQLTDTSNDLIDDAGSVLWSFVKGEQLEYPILLDFVADTTTAGFAFEAVVVEGLNVVGQTEKPTAIKPAGVQTVLTVRLPNLVGEWNGATAYDYEDVVFYEGKYYKLLLQISDRVSAITPDLDPYFAETTLNRLYVQFPATLASTWEVSPTVESSVYGFFELRVTEPTNAVFTRTWKPIRGMVEIQFSPTDIVP
jgi:hypothetical protein